MMHRVIGIIVTVALCVLRPVLAQDGQLLEASAVTLSDETLTQLETVEPTIRTILAQVDLRSMTYLSDGLKVKGYLAVPKRGDGLPCLIFNRGGNRAVEHSTIGMRPGCWARWRRGAMSWRPASTAATPGAKGGRSLGARISRTCCT
jgi:hypothetical protein